MKVAFYSERSDIVVTAAAWAAQGDVMRIYVLEEEAAELIQALKVVHASLPPLQQRMGSMQLSLLPLEEE
jgi:hypothetical protein